MPMAAASGARNPAGPKMLEPVASALPMAAASGSRNPAAPKMLEPVASALPMAAAESAAAAAAAAASSSTTAAATAAAAAEANGNENGARSSREPSVSFKAVQMRVLRCASSAKVGLFVRAVPQKTPQQSP